MPILRGLEPFEKEEREAFVDQAQAALKNAEKVLGLAGIRLPTEREELYVKESTVYQLHEYSQDENLFLALASLMAGAVLGVIVNWATSEQAAMSKAG